MLNIDLIKDEFHTAIHCSEKWQAVALIEGLDRALPGEVYKGAIDWWDVYKNETCYWPKFYPNDNIGIEYCYYGWFTKEKYRILDFNDVYYSPDDFGEIEVGDADISSLFMVV